MNSSDLGQGPLVECFEHGNEYFCFIKAKNLCRVTVSFPICTQLHGIWIVIPRTAQSHIYNVCCDFRPAELCNFIIKELCILSAHLIDHS
jgi:hypothetical protein